MEFCENKSCPMHKEVPSYTIKNRCYTFISEFTHKRVELFRHKFQTPSGKTVFLCTMCKGVVELVKGD